MTSFPNSGAAALLRLDGELTIYRAAELKPLLQQALHSAPQLEIDLGGVTDIDTSGVQLLMATKRLAADTQRSLRLSGHSPAVLEAFELLDLAAYFGDPLITPAA